MTEELRDALIDFIATIRARCAFRYWDLPDGSRCRFDIPLTAIEVAEACGIEDWRELNPVLEACHVAH